MDESSPIDALLAQYSRPQTARVSGTPFAEYSPPTHAEMTLGDKIKSVLGYEPRMIDRSVTPEERPGLKSALKATGMDALTLANFVGPAMGRIPHPAMAPEGGGAGGGFKAYHGSPHDFDKFDLSKIGTGEGAQAYGHGLYFAESPDAAKFYRDALSPELRKIKDTASPYASLSDADAIKKLEWAARQNEVNGRKSAAKDYRDAADWIRSGRSDEFSAGRLYEVKINADPEDFLDWDTPLSQQSEKVREAVNGVLAAKTGKDITPEFYGSFGSSGQGINNLVSAWTKHDAGGTSQALRDAGIPGIKYLDQNSRGTSYKVDLATSKGPYAHDHPGFGSLADAQAYAKAREAEGFKTSIRDEGTRNYVVFDDKLVDIIKKYGIAGLLAAGYLGGNSGRADASTLDDVLSAYSQP